jgi:hypothetical protein
MVMDQVVEPDAGTKGLETFLLLREIACQLADLNETLREVSEWHRAIGKKLDEIRDHQGGGQGPW